MKDGLEVLLDKNKSFSTEVYGFRNFIQQLITRNRFCLFRFPLSDSMALHGHRLLLAAWVLWQVGVPGL